MTSEEKLMICKILRRETACGMYEASFAIEDLINTLKNKPLPVMDNPRKLIIKWEDKE